MAADSLIIRSYFEILINCIDKKISLTNFYPFSMLLIPLFQLLIEFKVSF